MIQFRSFVRFIFAEKALQSKTFEMGCTYATVMRSLFAFLEVQFPGNMQLSIGFALIYTPSVIKEGTARNLGAIPGSGPFLRFLRLFPCRL